MEARKLGVGIGNSSLFCTAKKPTHVKEIVRLLKMPYEGPERVRECERKLLNRCPNQAAAEVHASANASGWLRGWLSPTSIRMLSQHQTIADNLKHALERGGSKQVKQNNRNKITQKGKVRRILRHATDNKRIAHSNGHLLRKL